MTDRPILTIGVLSDILGVHQRTLRIYDKKGLLPSKRTLKNRRMYSQNDIEKAKVIIYLTRNIALNLNGVKMILGILKETNTDYKKYTELISKVAIENKIDEKENLQKTSKRGRKPKSKK
ncbi:MAG: MerR family transcriptional regulator [Candidatus Gastranaerophilales bacterium]|nr:MerR family transcriptional regulator [Candidatus Gastranaerophilales bacterium]